MTFVSVQLASKKAEEYKKIFPDGKVPVSSLRVDYSPEFQRFCYHLDNSVVTSAQKKLLVAHLHEIGYAREGERDNELLARTIVFKDDTLCPDCGTEGPHNCQAETVSYPEPEDDGPDLEEDEYDEEVLENDQENDDL